MTTLLILPGWRVPASRYQRLKELFTARGYDVRSLEMPGFGDTNLEKSYTLDDYVEVVISYIKKEKLKTVILLGHSFGGRLAIRLSSLYPQYVKKLILTGVPGYAPVKKGKVLVFYLLSKIGNTLFSLPGLSHGKTFARKILYKLAGSTDYNKTNGYLRETFTSVIHQSLENDMRAIKAPVLLLWGDNDTMVPQTIAKLMKDTIKNSQLRILQSTHSLPYSNPEECAKIVDEFIEQ
jgi:pimeloyl-ACP methyl ester carboxylesterase